MKLKPVIEDSFAQYSAAVLQSRALVDVRDCFKPSARQIFYCMETDGFIHKKPYQKTLKAIGSAMRMYIHGDSSCEGIIMRAGQVFAMRYPLVEIEGNAGNLMSSGNYAAPRYTAARLSALSEYLFQDIDKETIKEWRDNYDNTEQYPSILPSKGFYNIVNGNFGIAVGASSSIPQYNLKELNEALIKLLWNPGVSFDDIYVAPDFATGAILLNAAEVKLSHKNGSGAACKLRSVVEWDNKERCFIVKEIPYMVYTETICKELEDIINSDDNFGIERFNDLTGKTPLIKIYLTKTANPDKVLKLLFKNTSLQSYYSVNFTMLDNGRYPKVFTWKEILQAHINHEVEVYTRGYEYDLRKLAARQHILDGYLICLASIEEVVKVIKNSSSTADAKINLTANFNLDDDQATAVLKLTLSRLAHLEVEKIKQERDNIIKDIEHIKAILADRNLLNKEIELGLKIVADKFGDARRTQILNIESESEEPVEVKQLQVSLTNCNNIFINETSSLYTQKRGGVGSKLKLAAGEYIISTMNVSTTDSLLFFSAKGNYYTCKASNIAINTKMSICTLVNCPEWENFVELSFLHKDCGKANIIFFTKKGYAKKSLLSEYNTTRAGGSKALTLDEDDAIIGVICTNEEQVGILTEQGNFLIIETKDIRPLGRIARGIHAIKLNDGDNVISAKAIKPSTKTIVSISGEGLIKQTEYNQFVIQSKNTKGSRIQKLTDASWMADFLPINEENEILIASTSSCIRININEIPHTSKGAQGVKAIKIDAKDNIIGISKI